VALFSNDVVCCDSQSSTSRRDFHGDKNFSRDPRGKLEVKTGQTRDFRRPSTGENCHFDDLPLGENRHVGKAGFGQTRHARRCPAGIPAGSDFLARER
jgi:hypothetical protein